MIPSKNAKPVFVGRVYTGINTGKVYPYASTKRSGAPRMKDCPVPRMTDCPVTLAEANRAATAAQPCHGSGAPSKEAESDTMFERFDPECIPGN